MTAETTYVVETARTRIRAFTRADVDAWQDWPRHRDPLFRSYDPPAIAPAERGAWYRDLTVHQRQLPFAVEDRSGALIGRIFLRHVNRSPGTAVLGIDFRPDRLSQGYGTEALGGFLRHYFETLGFDRLFLSVAAFNLRARRCYEKLGFRYLGSYWDHWGEEAGVAFHDPSYRAVRRLFRRNGAELEALFYNMALSRGDREAERR